MKKIKEIVVVEGKTDTALLKEPAFHHRGGSSFQGVQRRRRQARRRLRQTD